MKILTKTQIIWFSTLKDLVSDFLNILHVYNWKFCTEILLLKNFPTHGKAYFMQHNLVYMYRVQGTLHSKYF